MEKPFSTYLLAIVTLIVGYFLGNYRADREYVLHQYRRVTSELYQKAWEFLDAKTLIMTQGYPSVATQVNSLFTNVFNSFHGNTLFYTKELYDEISSGLFTCKNYMLDLTVYSQTGSPTAIDHSAFWKWYENNFFEWLTKQLRVVHNRKPKLPYHQEKCPCAPKWL